MSIYDHFGTDKGLETGGRWVDYGEGNGRFLIAHIAMPDSPYAKRLQALTKPYKQQIENETADNARIREIMVRAFAEKGILGWQGVKDRYGSDLPYSVESAIQLLSELPALFNDLLGVARDYTNFRREEEAADAKNFESA